MQVGGPDASDNFVDERSDYISNEVAIDYNSGYTGASTQLLCCTSHYSRPRLAACCAGLPATG
jgi:hypothetical protein